MWAVTLNFILALLIFLFNLLVLVSIASDKRLHTPTLLLSTNLWLCNCISAIVTIFYTLTPMSAPFGVSCDLHSQQLNIEMKYNVVGHSPLVNRLGERTGIFGPHLSAVILNSTVSLFSLLTIGIVQGLNRYDYKLTSQQSKRLLVSTWILAATLLFSHFIFLRVGVHLTLPFHVALLSVFLLLNLLIHPINLVLISVWPHRSQAEEDRVQLLEESVTASLWLLLTSLSFVIISLVMLWENNEDEMHKGTLDGLLGIELAAYSVHCAANPLIAIIRDRQLENVLTSLLFTTKRPRTEDDLVVALMRDPPPPYS